MESERMVIGVLIILVIVVIVLAVLLSRCNKDEPFCGTCQGLGNKVCTDRELLEKLYINGELTENSDLIRGREGPTLPYDKFVQHEYKNR